MANVANIVLPSLTMSGHSCVDVENYLCLCIQLNILAVSQYTNYGFDSLCRFNGQYLAAGGDGIFVIDEVDNDKGIDINSIIELVKTDFGISHQKRLRSAYVGYETSGSLKLTLLNDDENERVYTLSSTIGQLQHGGKISINRDGKGRYWTFKIENVEGCDFSLDNIEIIPIVLGRKPSDS